jgi:tetratricopeptide (TPR) repeat protein
MYGRVGGAPGCTKGLLHVTMLRRERNVVRNTLADTPSGYIQDPRASPKRMTRYDSVSRVGAAALEAMEQEKELLEREELAYKGYTTPRIQEWKRVVMEQTSAPAQLLDAVAGLTAELAALTKVVGQEVEKPFSQEHILLLKWQQRQQRLHDREHPFRAAPGPVPSYRVVLQSDGTEVVERPGRDSPQTNLAATDEAYLSQPVETEELPAAALVPERTVVTVNDVNHVRYLIGLALRRLSRFEEAEKMFYSVLADDVTNVDAVESLLEMDLGIEGWEPRIRVLLDFLVTEYDQAIREGRLQPPPTHEDGSDGGGDEGRAGGAVINDADVTTTGADGAGEAAEAETPAATQTSAPAGSRSHAASSKLPTQTNAVARRRGAAPYATIPQTPPIEVALSLLSDIIVEAAARKCSTDGEGATSRFFIASLGPIVRALCRDYAPALLEALFQAVDEQHFMARYDAADVSPAARAFALSLVIAFLKALTARRIHEMLPNPVLFEFFTLSKLHAALRQADRLHESYRICEKMMQLYRTNSALYRARLRRRTSIALARSTAVPVVADTTREQRMLSAEGCEVVDGEGNKASTLSPINTAPIPLQRSRDRIEVADTSGAVRPPAHGGDEADAFAEPPDVLDCQDDDYREAFFQYVNDRARDSPSLGRRLCLEAMQEFPNSAAPWETLALLLHKENPEKNLPDAIIAARHAMLLEPLNLSVMVTLANFYKAAKRYELHERMLDRYRLLVYMSEEGASTEDMLATAAEVEALDRETPEAQDLVEETGRQMSEYMFRMEQAMTYSMPIDKERRIFGTPPVRFFSQQADMRPPELGVHDPEPGERLVIDVPMPPLT